MRIRNYHAATTDVTDPRAHTRQPASILSFLALYVGTMLLQTACFSSAAQQAIGEPHTAPSPSAANHALIASNYGKLPLSFEANQGQVDPRVRFLSRGNGYSLFLTDKEAVLSLRKPDKGGLAAPMGALPPKSPAKDAPLFKNDVVRMQLAGASSGMRVTGVEKLPGTANYFIGNDPSRWHSNVPTFSKVRYEGVYPGVDLVYYGNQQQLEYDFIVKPGADAKSIRVRFAGAKKLKLDANGDLEVIATNGKIVFEKPLAYQDSNGKRQVVAGHFALVGTNTVGFELGAYDHSESLVIDPTVLYSTYFGPSGLSSGIATDSDGNAYVVGSTSATSFPFTSGAFQTMLGTASEAAYITKFNSSGTNLLYSTYLGAGNGSTSGAGIAVDSTGNAYVTGQTNSANYPVTAGAYQTIFTGQPSPYGNAFITKLNAAGTAIVYSTFLGGVPATSGAFTGYTTASGVAIAVDASGSAYVTGSSDFGSFPVTSGAVNFQTNPYTTSFVSKLSPDGSTLIYSALLGDNGPTCIALDLSGDAYVGGSTLANDSPVTPGAYQAVNNGYGNTTYTNGTIAELNATGSALVYGTYLGGSGPAPGDNVNGITVDSSGNAFVAGQATSANFPVTSGAFQIVNNGGTDGTYNAFVTKLNAAGSSLIYSTYVGGSGGGSTGGGDYASGIAIDATGNAYIAGTAVSLNFPTTSNAFQTSNHAPAGSSNAFVTEVNSSGSGLLFSTYLGGDDQDYATAIATDVSGNVYVTGSAGSYNFPVTSGAYQTAKPSGAIFVVKAQLGSSSAGGSIGTNTSLTADENPQAVGVKVTFTAYVQPSSGTGVPTGTVSFSIDGGGGTIEALDDTGHAGFAVSNLIAGSHVIKAAYSGDSSYATSSASLTETIIGPGASITVVSGSSQTAPYGSTFANPLVVVVKDANGNPVSGAPVTFTGAGLSFSSTSVMTGSNGEASVTATAISSGSLTATASTSGVTGTATFALTATMVPLTIAANNATAAYNQPIPSFTYTATGFVNSDTSAVLSGTPSETTTATQGSPAGTYPISISQGTLAAANYTFTFVNGTLTVTSLGTVATPTFSVAGGTYTSAQTVTIADTTPGAAIYYTTNGTTPTSGSTAYTGPIAVNSTETIQAIAVATGYTNSAVASALYTINLPSATFSLSASPSSASIHSGQSATFTLSVAPQNGFSQTVSFSCSGLPSGDACSFSPSTVTPAGSVVTSAMTIAPTTATRNSGLPLWEKASAGVALALLLWPFGGRRHGHGLAVLVVLIAGVIIAGCGGAPKPQSYTLSVTAAGGGVSQKSLVSLTVTP